ncbi:MAG: hypothetical protein M3323_01295 [Actinomycetota bacterium]|nr:hypothetical protein [Actinomycetota bacterium]
MKSRRGRSSIERAAAVALLAAIMSASFAPAARASCAGLPPMRQALRDAPAAFVGAVVATTNDGRWATVEVSEVWKGDVDARVEVRGGQADPPGPINVASSVDRHYREGKTYLFVPHAGSGSTFKDNSCTSTTAYRAALARFRPTGAIDPPAADNDGGDGFPYWIVGAAAAAAGIVLVARRVRGS